MKKVVSINSIAVQRVLFDFGLKKLFKKKFAFPPRLLYITYITYREFCRSLGTKNSF